jgi:hypothetical protein
VGPKTETRTIDGLEITITQLPVWDALELSSQILGAIDVEQDLGNLTRPNLLLFLRVCKILPPDQVRKLVSSLLRGARALYAEKDGEQAKFVELTDPRVVEKVFYGKLPTLLKVAFFSVEVNFLSFFDEPSLGTDSESEATAEVNSAA